MPEPYLVLTTDPCPECEGSGQPSSFLAGILPAAGKCGTCCGTGRRLVPLAEALTPTLTRLGLVEAELERVLEREHQERMYRLEQSELAG